MITQRVGDMERSIRSCINSCNAHDKRQKRGMSGKGIEDKKGKVLQKTENGIDTFGGDVDYA